jgi:GMP synthase (glutamine-hydrolysing)
VPRLLVIEHGSNDPAGPLGDWLRAAGLDLDVRDAGAGQQLPGDLSGHDGLLVLGGSMGATDDDVAPWLPQVRALLRAAVTGEVPTLGVCLGGQLLAVANGGRLGPNPDGPEIGAQLVAKRAAAALDPLFGPMPITPDVIQWHWDAVLDLPPGAIHLASSPTCEYQAFRLGRLAWGLQFHIETTAELIREWAAEDAEVLVDYDLERILARSDVAHADVAEVWQPFAAAFAEVVRDPSAVPPPRGVRTATAEPVTDPAAIRAALAAELSAARSPALLPMPGARPPGVPDA